MTRKKLIEQIRQKQSFLCIGLDPDIRKIPEHLLDQEDPLLAFNREIIAATEDLCVAYKPNLAFYECHGVAGWKTLGKTMNRIGENHFTIADAKRGDIGNTSRYYAKTFFEQYPFDSLTVAPYMGIDSVSPFLEFENKWVILLALTSNPGASDFQTEKLKSGEAVFEKVLKTSTRWGNADNLMYVVGATKANLLQKVRAIVPDSFLLVPGIGAQGGSLTEVVEYGLNKDCGLLVNSSRGIIYASNGRDFAEKARESAEKIQKEMARLLSAKNWL